MSESRPIAAVCSDLERLLAAPLSGPDAAFGLAEEVADHPEGIRAVPLLLALLERNPTLDWGAPGPVVHAVERFFKRGYEPLLLESVGRAPTAHTLWMVNRVINGVPPDQKGPLHAALRQAAARPDVPGAVRQAALEFLTAQRAQP